MQTRARPRRTRPARTRPALAIGMLAALALLAPACGNDDDSGTASDAGTDEATTTAPESNDGGPYGSPAETSIEVREVAPLGPILVDGAGMTLYMFESDSSDASSCYDACAEVWPPVLTSGEPQVSSPADAAILSTLTRDDGTTQVLYGGHPLYYFASDEAPGDATGQGVEGFGAAWYVVSADREPIEETR